VHLHGVPANPDTLVLPGRGMSELAYNEVFTRFMSPTMASSNVLYLGFSFDAAERHPAGTLEPGRYRDTAAAVKANAIGRGSIRTTIPRARAGRLRGSARQKEPTKS
jgi:hypothetical protein